MQIVAKFRELLQDYQVLLVSLVSDSNSDIVQRSTANWAVLMSFAQALVIRAKLFNFGLCQRNLNASSSR